MYSEWSVGDIGYMYSEWSVGDPVYIRVQWMQCWIFREASGCVYSSTSVLDIQDVCTVGGESKPCMMYGGLDIQNV